MSLPTVPTLIYDGDCPFCSSFATLYKAQETIGKIDLVDARENRALADELLSLGYNLDEGFVFIFEGNIHFGPDAMNKLAMLGSDKGAFNWLNSRFFSSASRSRVWYPVLKFFRNLVLRVLGRTGINGEKS